VRQSLEGVIGRAELVLIILMKFKTNNKCSKAPFNVKEKPSLDEP
jgi:hypothetical protein